jgi:ornithine carbamoyltransferase
MKGKNLVSIGDFSREEVERLIEWVRALKAEWKAGGNPPLLAGKTMAMISEIVVTTDPAAAAKGADALYTDVWASMGQESEAEERGKIFPPYQINQALVDLAKEDVLVMHCLPAHRGEEITAEVIDGPHSVALDEAENRLHVQKALMVEMLGF